MPRFRTFLSREYVVIIDALDEDAAREYTELYVSGGMDDSREETRLHDNFQIINIKPLLNEVAMVEDFEG